MSRFRPVVFALVLLLPLLVAACDSSSTSMQPDPMDDGGDEPSVSADVTVVLSNVGSSAWQVASVTGASGVAQTGTDNPDITLTVGTRYRVDNNGGSPHPLGFQNSAGNYLLNQNGPGTFEGDADVNYSEDADGVTFTYTQALADAVATYRCTIHGSMEGTVATQ